MRTLLRISFRNMKSSPAVAGDIKARAAALERFSDDIIGCHVTVEAPHRHHHQGHLHHVRIELKVAGADLLVSRDPAEHHAHEDVHVAVRDAFDAARRQLEDHARRRRPARGREGAAPAPGSG
jgi:ribosome-associated translation inhibitor RaiA